VEKVSDREKLLEEAAKYRKIAVVGLAKNVGKTTVVNFLLKYLANTCVVTIGHDGEDKDLLFGISKPPVLLPANSLAIVPASSIPVGVEILETFEVPSGKVSLVRSEVNTEVQTVRVGGFELTDKISNYLLEFCDRVLIDGAFGRMGMASYADATIVVTGAIMENPLLKTVKRVKKMLAPQVQKEFEKIIIDQEDSIVIKKSDEVMILDPDKDVEKALSLSSGAEFLYIPRVVDRTFFSKVKCMPVLPSADFVLNDDADFRVLKSMRIIAIAVNSTSPTTDVDPFEFLDELKGALNDIIVFDALYNP
jgi:hypothetical protein